MFEIIASIAVFILIYKVLLEPFLHNNRLSVLEKRLTKAERQIEKLGGLVELQEHDLPLEDPIDIPLEWHVSKDPTPQDGGAKLDTAASFKPPTEAEIKAAQKRDKEIYEGTKAPSKPISDTPQETNTPKVAAAANNQIKTGHVVDKKAQDESINVEGWFGAKLPVWIGGIALALAGFYLIKFSIDAGLLSPPVHLCFAALFGGALLKLGDKIRLQPSFKYTPDFANARQISQSLTGAGIAVLYGVTFAATNIHHYLPELLGYIAMAGVTALAVVLSLRRGAAIALLGLVGGFMTPAILSGAGLSLPLLFTYLGLTFAGLMIVFRAQKWWGLSTLAVGACLMWALVALFQLRSPMNSSIITLFLMFVMGMTLFVTKTDTSEVVAAKVPTQTGNPKRILNLLAVVGGAILAGFSVSQGGYVAVDWGLFALIGGATVALAYFNDEDYWYAPWISTGMTGLLLWLDPSSSSWRLLAMLGGFAALYMISSYKIMWRANMPLLWGGLLSAASVGAYLIGFGKTQLVNILSNTTAIDGLTTQQWAIVAIGLAACHGFLTSRVLTFYKGHDRRDDLLALFSLCTTAFLAFGLCALIKPIYWPIVIAAQCCATAWIVAKLHLPVLRTVCMVLVGVFFIAHLGQVFEFTIYESDFLPKAFLNSLWRTADNPLLFFGVPSALFAGTSLLLRKDHDGNDVRTVEVLSIGLLMTFVYVGLHKLLIGSDAMAGGLPSLVVRNILTAGFFIVALACMFLGQTGKRRAVLQTGLVLFGVGFLRIVFLEYGVHNPLLSRETVSGIVGFNSLLLPFGLPLLWLFLADKILDPKETGGWGPFYKMIGFVSLFTLVTLNVRFLFHGAHLSLFHGAHLSHGSIDFGEIFAYSIAWLLLGLGVLFLGTVKKDQGIRLAGLGLIGLTIFKVFLFDASQLGGILRVLSFLGLGASLIGLSAFYTRFILDQKDEGNV